MDLWSAWWHGENLRNVVVWGLPVFAWGRIGMLMGLLAPMVIIAEVVGVERLQTWGAGLGNRHDLKRSLLFVLLAFFWLCFIPLFLLVGARDTSTWFYKKWAARFGPVAAIERASSSFQARRAALRARLTERLIAFFGEGNKSAAKSSTAAFVVLSLLVAAPLALGITWESWQQLAGMAPAAAFSHFMGTLVAFVWALLLGFLFPGSVMAGLTLLALPLVGMFFQLCLIKPLAWVLSRDTLNVIKVASVFTFFVGIFLTLLAS